MTHTEGALEPPNPLGAEMSDDPKRRATSDEFRQLAERLQWGPGIASDVLGRGRKTIKRWIKGDLDVEPSDLAFMRRIAAFLDRARDLHFNTPPGDMTAEQFREAVYAFGWNPRPLEPPYFSTVAHIPQRDIRLMSVGRQTVSVGLQRGFAELLEELKEPPVLARQRALASHADLEEDADHDAG